MNTITRFCVECGTQFTELKPKTGRYPQRCTACRPLKRERSKVCKHCSSPFNPSSTGRVYCSPQCVAEATQRRAQAKALEAMTLLKQCRVCEQELDRSHFHSDTRRLDGLYPYCKDCRRARVGARKFTPSKWESRAEAEKHRVRKMREKHPELSNRRWRANHLWTTYRITLDEYEQMLAQQGGGCAICGTTDPFSSSTRTISKYRFAVDHDHRCCPGKNSCGSCVRGLLCLKCNTGLGTFGDSSATMMRAVDYLKRYEESAPLLNLLA